MAKSGSEAKVPHLTRFPYPSLSEQKVSAVIIPSLILDDTHQAEWSPKSPQAARTLRQGIIHL